MRTRFQLSVWRGLLFLGLAVMTLYLLLWFRWRVDAAGIVLPPLAAAAGFGALALLGSTAALPVARPRGWLLFHTTVSTLGMATLVVALAMSLIYLFQDRALKARRKLKLLNRLPPLDRCDHIGFQALAVGFVLMSVGIGAGPYACPYRWRPLTWEVDGEKYLNERATSTQQTGFSFVAQSRSWLPDPVGGDS